MKRRIVEYTHKGETVYYTQYRLYFLWWDEMGYYKSYDEALATFEKPVIKIHNVEA